MLPETWQRIYLILSYVTPVTDTQYTIPGSGGKGRTPKALQDYQGYVPIVRPARSTQDLMNSSQFEGVMVWTIALYSPQAGLGWQYSNELRMYQYADKIHEAFGGRPRLEDNNRAPLAWVHDVRLTGDAYTAPAPFPDGQTQLQRHLYTFTLTADYIRSRNC